MTRVYTPNALFFSCKYTFVFPFRKIYDALIGTVGNKGTWTEGLPLISEGNRAMLSKDFC